MYGTAGAVCQYVSDFKKGVKQVEEITVNIGELVTGNSGITNDTRQAVEFTGEKLGEYREYGTDRYGNITDTRGTTQTLYRTADGGLVVHVHEWSRWVGEPDTEGLYAVTEKSLQPGGAYDRLGAACGFGRPLTLAEAIGPRRAATGPAGIRETSSGNFVDEDTADDADTTDPGRMGAAGFLVEVRNDPEDWEMLESFLTWLLSVAKIENEPMQRLAACLNDLLQSRPDTNED